MKFLQIFFVLSVVLVGMYSCSNTGNGDGSNQNSIDTLLDVSSDKLNEAYDKAVIIFYSLPSPVETVRLMKRSGATFDETLLNPTTSVDKYSTSKALALNLGVYGADLSYANVFEQPQITINYMSASKKLADKLGITNVINDSVMSKFSENLNDRDFIMNMISEIFMNSSAFLKENQRAEISSLIVLGGWFEGLYLSMKLSQNSKGDNAELVNMIIDQKLSLEDMISLMDIYKDNPDVKNLLDELNEINKIYTQLMNENGELNKTAYNELFNKVMALRAKMVDNI